MTDRQGFVRPPRQLMIDGPPLPPVILVFVALLVVYWGPVSPGAGLAIVALGALALVMAQLNAQAFDREEEKAGWLRGSEVRFNPVPRPPSPERARRCP
jgi:hypothetical protein